MNNHEVTIGIACDDFAKFIITQNLWISNKLFNYDNEIRNYRGRNWKFRTTSGNLQRAHRQPDFELTLPVMIAIVDYFYGRIDFSADFQEIGSTSIIIYGNNMYVYISKPKIKAILRELGLDAGKLTEADNTVEVLSVTRATRNWNTQNTPDYRYPLDYRRSSLDGCPVSQAFDVIYYNGADSHKLAALDGIHEVLLFDDEEDYIMEAMEAMEALSRDPNLLIY